MNFPKPEIQSIQLHPNFKVDVLRIDAIDPIISGNKWYKLKYNIEAAQQVGAEGILTFGGQHSNHLAATAEACKRLGLKSLGMVRAEAQDVLSDTLQFVKSRDMHLEFVSRSDYKNKHLPENVTVLQSKYPNYFIVPEGGANALGRKGSEEIASYISNYDYVFCACGTATMYAGIRTALPPSVIVGGINVLKGTNALLEDVNVLNVYQDIIAGNEEIEKAVIAQSFITDRFSFKGYACFEPALAQVVEEVKAQFNLHLDHVYTSKLFFAVKTLLSEGKLPTNAKIVLIHSGGLQGNPAFERRYGL